METCDSPASSKWPVVRTPAGIPERYTSKSVSWMWRSTVCPPERTGSSIQFFHDTIVFEAARSCSTAEASRTHRCHPTDFR